MNATFDLIIEHPSTNQSRYSYPITIDNYAQFLYWDIKFKKFPQIMLSFTVDI